MRGSNPELAVFTTLFSFWRGTWYDRSRPQWFWRGLNGINRRMLNVSFSCFVRVIQINHDGTCTIDMLACHINQSVGATSGFGKFTASVLTDKD
jgi:hypothetical protein